MKLNPTIEALALDLERRFMDDKRRAVLAGSVTDLLTPDPRHQHRPECARQREKQLSYSPCVRRLGKLSNDLYTKAHGNAANRRPDWRLWDHLWRCYARRLTRDVHEAWKIRRNALVLVA